MQVAPLIVRPRLGITLELYQRFNEAMDAHESSWKGPQRIDVIYGWSHCGEHSLPPLPASYLRPLRTHDR